ncbi:MAG: general secretion pathway protein D [Halieaceae bacterium]
MITVFSTKLPRLAPALLVLLAVFSLPLAAQNWTVNLQDTDIQELIKFVAEATDTTIVVDPKVKGKVKVISNKPVNSEELYELFLSILDVHGFTAIRTGNIIRILPNKDARSAPVPVVDDSSSVSDEYTTQVIQLENISAAKLIPVLRPLVPQQAHMAAYAPSNAIIISDIQSNITRIRSIIDKMDKSAVQTTEVLALEYAIAEDVVSILDKLNKDQATKSGAATSEVLLVADPRTNSVLINGDELERQRMRDMIRYLDTPLEQSGNVKVTYLKYANAVDLAAVLTKVMQNMDKLDADRDKSRGAAAVATIEADEGTNALIITADTGEMRAIENVIGRLDIRRAQVLVEAIIVELTVQDGQDFGIQWMFQTDNGVYGSTVDPTSNVLGSIAGAILDQDDTTTTDTAISGTAALASTLGVVPGTTFGVGRLGTDVNFNVLINALQANSEANILSTPSLLTMDNHEAFITVGQNVPFVTGSYSSTGNNSSSPSNPFQTIERENVGVSLYVTPHINEGDSVVLDIEQEISSVSPSTAASDIITNERKISTKVLAGDGEIIVLGGLIEDDVSEVEQRVPLLGSIPFLGRLFRSTSVNLTKRNLLVFLRPTIMRESKDLAGATAEKYRYIRDQQMLKRAQGSAYLEDHQLPLLPEWAAQVEKLQAMREEKARANLARANETVDE